MNSQLNIFDSIHQNSLEAWYGQILPNLTERQTEVLNAIKTLGKATLYDLEKYLNRSKNTFSGRISELKKQDLIKQVDRVKIGESSFSVYTINKAV